MDQIKLYNVERIVSLITDQTKTVRKHCNADNFIRVLRRCFQAIPDHRQVSKTNISLDDALMSAYAMFSLKDPSLLAFENRRLNEAENLRAVFGIENIASDTQMREILDSLSPRELRSGFTAVFRILQRGKDLEAMTCLDGHYLISGDGTGFYYSTKVGNDFCLRKKQENGKHAYYQQMYAAAIVHPDKREVIPFCPEMISNQDGTSKQDCERAAAQRFWREFRREHPHLPVIVTEDALSSNAPHIRELKALNLRFILGVKPGDHQFLFEQFDASVETGKVTEFNMDDPRDPKKYHVFRYVNGLSLNKSNQDLKVNLLEYWQADDKGNELRFAWVTDLEITKENAYEIMRAGRARWRIENETFNTLKNQGYHLGHNYGLGAQYLSMVFTTLMMLAFLVDQAQQLGCWLFRKAWEESRSKRQLWENVRSRFRELPVDSMETLYRSIAFGIKGYVVEVIEPDDVMT